MVGRRSDVPPVVPAARCVCRSAGRSGALSLELGLGGSCRHVVDAPVAPGVTPAQPLRGEPGSPQGTVSPQGSDGIRRAGGVVAAGLRAHRRHEALVEDDECDQWCRHHLADALHLRPAPIRARTFGSTRSSSAASCVEFACAAAGFARTTTSVPTGMSASRVAISARSLRLVRLRTTAPPTALETTKPTRGGCPARASVRAEWTTTSWEPARAPLGPLSAAENSELVRSRCPAGSTGTASGGELGAALGAASRQDGATRTGPHPQAEAVGLGPTTVVRLESTLAHEVLRYWSGPVGPLSAGGRRGGRNRKPAPRPAPDRSSHGVSRACENGRQACSKVREREPQGKPAHQVSSGRAKPRPIAAPRSSPPRDTPTHSRSFPAGGKFSVVWLAPPALVLLPSVLVPPPYPQVVDKCVDKAP